MVGHHPGAVAANLVTNKIYVANQAVNTVTVIDGTSDSVVGTMSLGSKPQAIAIDSTTHKVYVISTHESTATILDGIHNSKLGTVQTEKAPFAIAVNSQTHAAVALSLDGQLTLIDGNTLATSSPVMPDER